MSKECSVLRWCFVFLVSFLGAMRILSQGCMMRVDLGIDSSLSIILLNILAIISIKREFLIVNVENDIAQIFYDRSAQFWKRN